MQFNKTYISLVLGLLALAGVLIYLNFKGSESELPVANEIPVALAQPFSYDDYYLHAKDTLNIEFRKRIDSLESLVKADTGNYQANMLLADAWNEAGFELIAAQKLVAIATRLNDERSWRNAGFKFYDFASITNDTTAKNYGFKQAIIIFEKIWTGFVTFYTKILFC